MMHLQRMFNLTGTPLLITLAFLSKTSIGRPILALSGPNKDTWLEPIIERLLISQNESMPFDSTSDTGETEAPKQSITPLVTGVTAGLLVFFLSIILGWMYYRHVVRKARRKAQRQNEEQREEKNERKMKVQKVGRRGDKSRTRSTLNTSGSKSKRQNLKKERAQRPTSRPRAGPGRESRKDEVLSIPRETFTLPSNVSCATLSSTKISTDGVDQDPTHDITKSAQTEPHAPIQAYLEPSSRSGSVSSTSESTSSSDSERTRFAIDRSDKFVDDVKDTFT